MVLLQLNLHRQFFCAVLNGSKKIEYRERSDYWERRLTSKKYTHIRFRNGYLKAAPEMIVELKKTVETKDCYELHLGKIVDRTNTDLLT